MEQMPTSYQTNVSVSPIYFTLAMVVAVVSFIAGTTVGYMGRPLVAGEQIANQAQSTELIVDAIENLETKIIAQNGSTTTETASSANENNENNENPASTGGDNGQAGIMDLVLADAKHYAGDPNAPVTIVEFSDFKCGYCGRFYASTLNQLRKEYVDTGKVQFVYKHFAILGPESSAAAEASECAAEQDKFWDFHDAVFSDQTTQHTSLTADRLTAIADSLGIDTTTFTECIESGRYVNTIRQQAMSIQSLGVRGTPAFLVDGVLVSGAQPYDVFAQIIDERLQAN